ncbi:hypothetical protein Mal15_06450 [Stieleria maiorica]|uniref:Uncharacterized protein n=1 Tax=Stieleria maiorica TaxID=2795974 RepID=A0A5B9MBN8_9BACT|nr:hypothetical protein [Stieleria maiorica]QEF96617.1 hypothetical protein Mal15_06450 [Stieleria maiorica]
MMSAVTIKRYDQLSADQWRRVAVTAKRHVKQITGQSCEIGIGRKYSAGKPAGRQLAIRVYLPKKRRRVARAKQVPAHFKIRLKRSDGKFDRLRIRSDVESLGDYVPTGARVNVGRYSATAGFLLRWKHDDGEIRWGLATVGHLFDQTRLRIVSVRVNPTVTFRCRRLKTPPKRNHIDLAVLEIIGDQNETEAKLLRCGLIESVHPPAISLMSVRQVHRAVMGHRRGRTYPPDGDRDFVGEEVFPDGFQLGSRILEDCVRVGRSQIDTFRQGTSGSAWSIGARPACLQVGGKETDFREGIGQPFDLCLKWIRSSIAPSADVVAVW